MDPWQTISDQRLSFADLLDGLTDEQWEAPSLCEGWTVADVATHMMTGPTGSLWSFTTAMVEARGDFSRASRILVSRKTDRPRSQIVTDLREFSGSRFTPPTMDWHAPLTDHLVHRLDVTHPLGIGSGVGAHEAWAPALDFIVSKKATMGFMDRGLPQLTYRAEDVAWRHGSGPEVVAPAEALALALTRRPVRLEELSGPGADRLRAWATRAA
jgi:uncharacterized protein (TIGR03083 family)